jgi:hypothetical protein
VIGEHGSCKVRIQVEERVRLGADEVMGGRRTTTMIMLANVHVVYGVVTATYPAIPTD